MRHLSHSITWSLSLLVAQSKGFLDMSTPLFYILAPFGLAFALFAVYLVVSLFLKDPARPFRMFAAPPLDRSQESSDQSPEEKAEEDNKGNE